MVKSPLNRELVATYEVTLSVTDNASDLPERSVSVPNGKGLLCQFFIGHWEPGGGSEAHSGLAPAVQCKTQPQGLQGIRPNRDMEGSRHCGVGWQCLSSYVSLEPQGSE